MKFHSQSYSKDNLVITTKMFSASLARRGNIQTKHHKAILSIKVILKQFTKIVVRLLFTNNLLAGTLPLSDEAEVKHGFHCVLKRTFDDVILVFCIGRDFPVLADFFSYWPSCFCTGRVCHQYDASRFYDTNTILMKLINKYKH